LKRDPKRPTDFYSATGSVRVGPFRIPILQRVGIGEPGVRVRRHQNAGSRINEVRRGPYEQAKRAEDAAKADMAGRTIADTRTRRGRPLPAGWPTSWGDVGTEVRFGVRPIRLDRYAPDMTVVTREYVDRTSRRGTQPQTTARTLPRPATA
jgi:hypothetical protein